MVSEEKRPMVAIIILNWNGWQDTIECLESLYQITYPNFEVIVVDNGSKEKSIRKIREYAGGKIKVESKFFKYDSSNKPIKIIEYTREDTEAKRRIEIDNPLLNKKLIIIKNQKNYGFAEGNNIGIRYALNMLNSKYVLLLNNDTVVDKEFLGYLVKVGKMDNRIGIMGPKINYYDYHGRSDVINFIGSDLIMWKGLEIRYGAGEIDRGQWDTIQEVDKIEGSCMLREKNVFKKIGMLDPKYFAYWEETDFCARAKKAGNAIVCVPNAKIWHKVSTTARKMSGFYEYHMTRNMFWFMKKHATRCQFLLFLLFFFGFQLWRIGGIHLIRHRNINSLKSFLKGVKDGVIGF